MKTAQADRREVGVDGWGEDTYRGFLCLRRKKNKKK